MNKPADKQAPQPTLGPADPELGPPEPNDQPQPALPGQIPLEVPEADAIEQAEPWSGEPLPAVPLRDIPLGVPEADALDQATPVPGSEEDEDWR
jgi:hypothetical protein